MLLTEIIRYLEFKQVIDPPTTNEEILINHIEKITKSVLSFIKTASDAVFVKNLDENLEKVVSKNIPTTYAR